jgi:hypothetical protein
LASVFEIGASCFGGMTFEWHAYCLDVDTVLGAQGSLIATTTSCSSHCCAIDLGSNLSSRGDSGSDGGIGGVGYSSNCSNNSSHSRDRIL